MAWSIFDLNNGDAVATAWATALLAALGIQATPERVQFIYDWEQSEGGGGKFNPLNQGPVPGQPSLTTTGSQYGGGAADFANWEAGIQGAVDYLHMPNFQGVLAALQGNNYSAMTQALWDSPWAGSHYGYGSAWNTSNYVSMSPAELAGVGNAAGFSATTGTALQAAANQGAQQGSNSSVGSVPGMNDIPGLVQYIQANFPDEAWLLNIPSVATVLEQAVAGGENSTQIQAVVANSQWWKDTSAAMRQYEQNLYTNPADYSFTAPGSQAAQKFADVVNQSAQVGVTLSMQQAQQIALKALQYGWDTSQIQVAIGQNANQQNSQAVVSQLQSQQGQYLIPISPTVMNSWVQNIAEGTQSMQQWEAYLKQQAALKWTGMAPQLSEGYTPVQIVSNLQDNAAQIMETSPQAIDFINNPQYAKILDFTPPGETTPRMMTQSEESQYLKNLPQYAYTQNARDSVSQLAQQITQTFGKIG